MTAGFYDELAPLYHLVYEDWDASIDRQARNLDTIIRAEWGESVKRVLDAAAGVGTQALGLSALGYDVTASDVSRNAIGRAAEEAERRGLVLRVAHADLRQLSSVHAPHDLVMACDNALPHLLSDDDLLLALRECYSCTIPGGGCLFSVRDYGSERRSGRELRPYGARQDERGRTVVFQVWDWDGDYYDLAFYFVEDHGNERCHTRVMRTRYYAVTVERLLELMQEAGYDKVKRIDHAFFQPVLVGTRPHG